MQRSLNSSIIQLEQLIITQRYIYIQIYRMIYTDTYEYTDIYTGYLYKPHIGMPNDTDMSIYTDTDVL